jgi:hypothetical protein
MRSWIFWPIAIAAVILIGAANHSAESRKSMSEESTQPAAMYLWPVYPPDGWFHNLESSRKVGLQIMTPKPTDSDAVIYVQASLKEKDLELRIASSHENLRKSAPTTTISKMPEVLRKNGQPAFQFYRYETPGAQQQPLEYVAFGEARYADGKMFALTVTLTGNDPRAIEKYGAIYRTFLAAH